jgi:thiamine biosynthesis protein ThiC
MEYSIALGIVKNKILKSLLGPGHVHLNEIGANMQLEKKLCHGAPFYDLIPIVTDLLFIFWQN